MSNSDNILDFHQISKNVRVSGVTKIAGKSCDCPVDAGKKAELVSGKKKGTQPIVFGTPLAGWVDFKGFWLD